MDDRRTDGQAPPGEGPAESPPLAPRLLGLARILAGIVLFGLVALAAVGDWAAVRQTVSQLSPIDLVLSELLALAALGASALTWRRALREFGYPLPVPAAAKIYLVGQLGKYLPGSVWAVVVQMELARRVGVPRLTTIASAALAIAVNLVVGLSIGVFAVPTIADGRLWRYALLFALFAAAVAVVLPPVQRRLLHRLGRGSSPAWGDRHFSWPGISAAAAWSVVSWACYGLSLWVLVQASEGPSARSLWLSVTGVAIAMTAGFVVFVAPAGIGVREAVIVAALAPVLEPGAALGVALVFRLVFTLADLAAAAVTVPIRLVPQREIAGSAELATHEGA